MLGRPARPYRPDDATLPNGVTLLHRDRAEVDKRHCIAAGRLDRHDLSVRPDRAREGDDARRRYKHRLLALPGHVDAPVLAARVRVAAVDERLEHVTRGRPRPCVGGGHKSKCGECGSCYGKAAHRSLLVGEIDNNTTVAGAADVVNSAYIKARGGRGGREGSTSAARRDRRRPVARGRRRLAPRRPRRRHLFARRTTQRRPGRGRP